MWQIFVWFGDMTCKNRPRNDLWEAAAADELLIPTQMNAEAASNVDPKY